MSSHKASDQQQQEQESKLEKSQPPIESYFDSGYSATAMSLNSSSDVHHHPHHHHEQTASPSSSSSCNLSLRQHEQKRQRQPASPGDSGLCIDSGLSITDSSTHEEKKVSNVDIDPALQCFLSDSFSQDEEGDTLLHLAIIKGSARLALDIINLAIHPDQLDMRNHLYQTPLILAALTGQATIARRLVLAGATIDKRDKFGGTALHVACSKGDIEMTSTLLAPISPLEVKEVTNRASYKCKLNSNNHNLNQHSSCSQLAATHSSSSSLSPLDLVHSMDYEGQTCVHLAAKSGNKKLLEFLMRSGADLNVREGKSGLTILHLAIMTQKVDLVMFLINNCRVNVHVLSYSGLSALKLAMEYSASSNSSSINRISNIIRILKEAGATSNDTSSSSSESDLSSSDED